MSEASAADCGSTAWGGTPALRAVSSKLFSRVVIWNTSQTPLKHDCSIQNLVSEQTKGERRWLTRFCSCWTMLVYCCSVSDWRSTNSSRSWMISFSLKSRLKKLSVKYQSTLFASKRLESPGLIFLDKFLGFGVFLLESSVFRLQMSLQLNVLALRAFEQILERGTRQKLLHYMAEQWSGQQTLHSNLRLQNAAKDTKN